MTYEEKFEKVVEKLREERKFARKGRPSKYRFDDNSFTKISITDICKILLQLQDDEKVLQITQSLVPIYDSPGDYGELTNLDNYDGIEIITVEFGEDFDRWYSEYLLKQKSGLHNLDWLNLLKVLDICIDVDNKLQISNTTHVVIPALPYPNLGRFPDLFPFDSVGTRKVYMQHRWEGARYLLNQGIASFVKAINDSMLDYGNIKLIINLDIFEDFYKKVKSEYVKRNKKDDKPDKEAGKEIAIKDKEVWTEDFKWDGNSFIFGKYGSISFTSKDRMSILQALTDKKGGWASISELKGDKTAGYVRSTIKQIEDRLPETAKGHISIVSTQEDDTQGKPNAGAYRIKIT